jgi:cobalamin biosynthesis protein CobT
MRLEVAVAAQLASLDKQTIREITLTIEFLTTTLRAVVDGHPVASHMVQQPFLFAHGKVNDLAHLIYQKAA